MAKNLNLVQLSARLGLTLEQVNVLVASGEIKTVNGFISSKDATNVKKHVNELKVKLGLHVPSSRNTKKQPAQKSFQSPQKRSKSKDALKPIKAASEPVKAVSRTPPTTVTLHMGPTNSGKTYEALKFLAEAGSGVYASPLRMLAFEAYEKLKTVVGPENVGLLTGEESYNTRAPIMCVTPEVAPSQGKVLVVDEAQWVKDTERGWAWTALFRSEFEHVHICGTREVQHLAQEFYSDAKSLVVQQHERLADLKSGGLISLEDIPPRSVVVAFSKKKVLALARELITETGVRPAVLYGSLPPQVRRAELEYFNSGKTDIMVATDVIGHGVNMPVDNVIFAEARKFDGVNDRELETWELAQIAGRAGRFGLSEYGTVYGLKPYPGFTVSVENVNVAVDCAKGVLKTSNDLNVAYLAPTFEELNVSKSENLRKALTSWSDLMKVTHEKTPVNIDPMTQFFERLDDINFYLTRKNISLTLEQTWALIRLPLNRVPFRHLMRVIVSPKDMKIDRMRQDPEAALGVTKDLIKFTKIMKHRSPFSVSSLESEVLTFIEKIMLTLDDTVRNNTFGLCVKCSNACSPNMSMCDNCFNSF